MSAKVADDWPKFAHHLTYVRAAGQCECRGQCSDKRCLGGRCCEMNGRRSVARKQVVAVLRVVDVVGSGRRSRDMDDYLVVCQWCDPAAAEQPGTR